jgi:6-phosphogluconolactonase
MKTIKVTSNLDDLIAAAAELVLTSGAASINERDRFSLALSGGSTPQPLYEHLAQEQFDQVLDWNKVHFFWGDERVVAPDHPDSNFFQANQAMLQPRKFPGANIHRMQGELDPTLAAQSYENELIDWFQEPLPRFDLILLGLGSDGHTASLFPGTKALESPHDYDLIAANHVPQLDTWRITFTAKLINAARQVLFLVSGESKADVLHKILEDPGTKDQFPAQLIQPTDGDLIWLVDCAAGILLSPDCLDG